MEPTQIPKTENNQDKGMFFLKKSNRIFSWQVGLLASAFFLIFYAIDAVMRAFQIAAIAVLPVLVLIILFNLLLLLILAIGGIALSKKLKTFGFKNKKMYFISIGTLLLMMVGVVVLIYINTEGAPQRARDEVEYQEYLEAEKIYSASAIEFKSLCEKNAGTFQENLDNKGYNTNTSTWQHEVICVTESKTFWALVD